MRLFKLNKQGSRPERHFIDLDRRSRHETSISNAFKIWAGAYAVAMIAGLCFASGVAHSAPAPQPLVPAAQSAATNDTILVSPNDMQTGALLFRAKEQGRFIQAPRVATDIKVDITGPVARTVITQKFLNPSDAWLEGIYVFPLPDNSAVDTLRMKIGDRLIEGLIKPKQEAREIYETAKREGKKASLLEQHRPNLFTNAVANIGPNEAITVQIEYQETLSSKGDEFSLRIPLVVAPRYNPAAKPLKPVIEMDANQSSSGNGWGSTDPVPDREQITAPTLDPQKDGKSNPVTLSIELKAGFPLEDVVSHYHDVLIEPAGDDSISLSLKNEAVPADKDFLLTWTGKQGTTPNLGLFAQSSVSDETDKEEGETASKEHFLLAYITPPYKLAETLNTPPREVIFVLDHSGSMAGPSIRQAQNALIEALSQLKPEDKFQIIRFNNRMSQLFDAPRLATTENVSIARYWTAAIEAQGGTEMLPAMEAALNDKDPAGQSIRQVIFLTDGSIGNERQLFEAVKQNKGRSRIFTVGIGSAPNSFFMSRAAEVGRGTFTHIGDISEVKDKMGKLFTQLTTPVATDLVVELQGGQGIEASPSALPDLYLGEPLVIALKAKVPGEKLILKGRFDNQPWSLSVDLAKAAPSNAIDKLWARGKIRQLENDRLLASTPNTIDKMIETLGLKHHLVTRLTSLVAVDVTPSRPVEEGLESKKVPLNLPDGWDMEKVFGDEETMMDTSIQASNPKSANPKIALFSSQTKRLLAAQPAPQEAPAAKSKKIAALASAQSQIMLPKTATLADLILLAGNLILLLAGSLLVWIQWCKTGRS